jgi:hypothetical protein
MSQYVISVTCSMSYQSRAVCHINHVRYVISVTCGMPYQSRAVCHISRMQYAISVACSMSYQSHSIFIVFDIFLDSFYFYTFLSHIYLL